jgi:hypothetical protein
LSTLLANLQHNLFALKNCLFALVPCFWQPPFSCALASPPAFATLSFVSSSADAKPLLSHAMASRAQLVINEIYIILQNGWFLNALHALKK